MQQPVFALIFPLAGYPSQGLPPGFGGGHPDQGLPGGGWSPTDPGYGRPGGGGHPDQGLPGYGHADQGLPGSGGYPSQGLPGGGGHPGNALPIAPVVPTHPIYHPDKPLPPGEPLPPHASGQPIVIPPDPAVGISQPIYLPANLPQGSTLIVPLPGQPSNTPKDGVPVGSVPAIAFRPGNKPVLVYVSAATMAQPK